MRAGHGVRDGAPNPHAGRATPPLPGAPAPQTLLGQGSQARGGNGGRRGRDSPAPPHSRGIVGTPQPRFAPRPRVVAPPSWPLPPPQSRLFPGGAGPSDGAPGQWQGGEAGAGRGRRSGRGFGELGRKSGQAARRLGSGTRSAQTLRVNARARYLQHPLLLSRAALSGGQVGTRGKATGPAPRPAGPCPWVRPGRGRGGSARASRASPEGQELISPGLRIYGAAALLGTREWDARAFRAASAEGARAWGDRATGLTPGAS